jgi:hypothetical protein
LKVFGLGKEIPGTVLEFAPVRRLRWFLDRANFDFGFAFEQARQLVELRRIRKVRPARLLQRDGFQKFFHEFVHNIFL